jgi:hypothetical protein
MTSPDLVDPCYDRIGSRRNGRAFELDLTELDDPQADAAATQRSSVD